MGLPNHDLPRIVNYLWYLADVNVLYLWLNRIKTLKDPLPVGCVKLKYCTCVHDLEVLWMWCKIRQFWEWRSRKQRELFFNSGLCLFIQSATPLTCVMLNMFYFVSVTVSLSNFIFWVSFKVCCDPFICSRLHVLCEES